MNKAFNVGRNVMAAYGVLSLVTGIVTVVKLNKFIKETESADKTIHKERGKTYFSVQNKEHDETQPMGFHIG